MGPWADMIRMRIDVRLRRLGLGRERPSLRCDLFEPPAAAGRGQGSPSIPRHPFAAPPIQGSLF